MEFFASLMTTLAAGSLVGVFCATFLERLVPVLPSHVLMLGIGIAAQRLDVSLPATVLVSLLGSLLGSSLYFIAGRRLGQGGRAAWVRRCAQWPGLSLRRLRRGVVAFRRNAAWMAVVSQLAPGLRLVSPAMAGAVGIPARVYFPYAAFGMAIWNLFFVATGHACALKNPDVDATAIALVVIGVFLGLQVAAGVAWWAWRRRARPQAMPAHLAVAGGGANAGTVRE